MSQANYNIYIYIYNRPLEKFKEICVTVIKSKGVKRIRKFNI